MKVSNIIGGILLVSCTTIGAGILALPTATISSGFIPTSLAFFICWFFMLIGALLLLEVNLWQKNETNLISMASHTIGFWGKAAAWICYLLLLYSLICAYLTGSGAWLVKITHELTDFQIQSFFGPPIVALILGIIIYLGTYYTDRFNRILAIGLFIFFLAIIVIGFPYVDTNALTHASYQDIPLALPIIITTFGFAIIVPSLTFYLKNNTKYLLITIIIGSLIPLICYLLWEVVTLGSLSISGKYGLMSLAQSKADGTQVALALEKVIGNDFITKAAKTFSIFAILTSLIGVSLSLFHFLSDGLKISKRGFGGITLFFLTFLPPLIAINVSKSGFNEVLSFAGIFVAYILGILPVTMVWRGRYVLHKATGFKVFGGKFILILTALFFAFVIVQELGKLFL